MSETLNPRNDAVFKLLFADARNRELLISLLNAVLQPARPILAVDVVNPEIQKDAPADRGLVLDIVAVHDDRTRTDVEMQSYARKGMPLRALYHWARLFRHGIARGEDYRQLHPCRVVFILAHEQLPGTRFHGTFRALEVHDGTLFSDAFEIHTIELPKLAEVKAVDPEDGAAHDWARFFAAETDEERKQVAMRNQDIGKANEALERLSQDPAARELAQAREDQLLLFEAELGTARQEGREEGREEGIRTAMVAIEALCEVLDVELTPVRRSALIAMGTQELTELLDGLRRQRRWPDH